MRVYSVRSKKSMSTFFCLRYHKIWAISNLNSSPYNVFLVNVNIWTLHSHYVYWKNWPATVEPVRNASELVKNESELPEWLTTVEPGEKWMMALFNFYSRKILKSIWPTRVFDRRLWNVPQNNRIFGRITE